MRGLFRGEGNRPAADREEGEDEHEDAGSWPGPDREPGVGAWAGRPGRAPGPAAGHPKVGGGAAGGRPPAGSGSGRGGRRMGARERLNAAYAGGAAVFAAFVGAGFKSWTVFAVVLAAVVALCLLGGHIRPAGRRG